MTKKEIVQYLKENMPEFSGDEVEQEIKKAMYIYLELGKIKSSDERYLFGNSKTKEKLYKLYERNKRNTECIVKDKKVVCVTMSVLYKKILKEFGINCFISEPCPPDKHVYPVIVLSNGKYIEADLQQDLHNIQTKSRTKYFGQYKYTVEDNYKYFTNEEIYNMQKEIGYVKDEAEYMDNKIEKFEQKVQNMNSEQMLEALVTDQELNIYNSKLEYSEFYKYYRNLIRRVGNKISSENIHYFNCYRNINDSDQKEYSMCLYSTYKDKVKVYLSSNKTNSFIPVDLLTLKQLELNGLFLGSRQNESGVKLLRKYINKAEKQRIIEKWGTIEETK